MCADASAARPLDVLVFTKTEVFRHASIDDGVALVHALGRSHRWNTTSTDDTALFTARRLRRFEVVVFLSTNREVLDPAQKDALEAYVRGGGGWAGVHSAADTEYGWPFYGTLLGNGAWFRSHPPIQQATMIVEDRRNPSTRRLGTRWVHTDEWYAFKASPRPRARVLLRVDESTYDAGDSSMGEDHPIAWCRRVGRGRSWYTAIGHTPETYAEPKLRRHLLGGIRLAAGRARADCSPRRLVSR